MAGSWHVRVDSAAQVLRPLSKPGRGSHFSTRIDQLLEGRAIWGEGAGIKHRVDEWKVTETIIGSCDWCCSQLDLQSLAEHR